MYTYTSDHPYDLIVVHTNEGPEGPRSAENLAGYLNRLTASDSPGYHMVGDEDSTVRMCSDGVRVNGAGGVNSRAWHFAICGYAGQDASQWNDDSSIKSLRLAAEQVRNAGRRIQVPLVRIYNVDEARGICGHADVSAYHDQSQGHTDPGNAFPWTKFMSLVNKGFVSNDELRKKTEMYRCIMGDKSDTIWLTNWLEKRRIGSPDEVNAIIKAGVTDGAGIVHWPQAWVDNIPVKLSDK